MSEYVFFFFPRPDCVPSFELYSGSSDKAAMSAAVRLASEKTACSKIEIWRDGRHLAHLPCRVVNRYDWTPESPETPSHPAQF